MATLAALRRRTRPSAPIWAHLRHGSTVKLAVDRYPKPSEASSSKGPLVILHGLYGSKQNWRTLAKRLAQGTQSDVYALVRPISEVRGKKELNRR